jgi:hypothetical protein
MVDQAVLVISKFLFLRVIKTLATSWIFEVAFVSRAAAAVTEMVVAAWNVIGKMIFFNPFEYKRRT